MRVRMEDVCDVRSGYAFKSAQYVPQGVRIIRITNVQKGSVEDAAPVFYPPEHPACLSHALRAGDILISLTGNVGRAARLPEEMLPAALNQRVACVRVKNDERVDENYLFALLSGDDFEQRCVAAARGQAQLNLSIQQLRAMEIELPPMEEQRRMAMRAQAVIDVIDLRRKQLSIIEDLKQARFDELFGASEKARLDAMAGIDCGHAYPGSVFSDSGVPVIRIADISGDEIDLTRAARIDPDVFPTQNRIQARQGDLLLAMSGSTGKAGMYRESVPALINQRVARIRCFEAHTCPEFLLAALRSDTAQRFIVGASAGCAQRNISVAQVAALPVPAAELAAQQRFAEFVREMDAMRAEIASSIEWLNGLRRELIKENSQ